ncbi:unnamed protein product [Schistocephalus solidus]|uniref:Secreted protein n=1 Tax=Schistocephalus solidus TaxID=70667 RepID=A0A183SEH8_SCHSO|nr:unnamed protein product [Schistocephalus solidus]
MIAFGHSICLVHVVNAPVATSNWYPTLTCGSSKLVFPSGHTPGNRHDRRTKPGEGLRCYSGHTPGNRHDRRAKPGEGLRCAATPRATVTTGGLNQVRGSGVVGNTWGKHHDQRAKQGEGLRCCVCLHTRYV